MKFLVLFIVLFTGQVLFGQTPRILNKKSDCPNILVHFNNVMNELDRSLGSQKPIRNILDLIMRAEIDLLDLENCSRNKFKAEKKRIKNAAKDIIKRSKKYKFEARVNISPGFFICSKYIYISCKYDA